MSPNFARYRPTLETLEGRCVPAVVVTTLDLDSDGNADDLRIVGDTHNNGIVIEDDGATLLLDVDKNGDGDFTDPGELLDDSHTPADGSIVLEIQLSDGNDTIDYSLTGNLSADRRLLTADLGLGNDGFTLDGTLFNLSSSSELVVDLLAGKGGDTLSVGFPQLSSSLVSFQAALGGGFDDAALQTTAVNSLGALDIDLDLGGGSNECTVTMASVGTTGAGFVDVDVTGSNAATQSDKTLLVLSGTTGGGGQVSSVSIDMNLLAGNDEFKCLLTSTAANVAALGIVDVAIQGGAGSDQIELLHQGLGPNHLAANGVMEVELKGGLGNDSINVLLIGGPNLEVDGRFRLRIEGNEGNDTIAVAIKYVAGSSGNLDIAIYANAGNDSVTYELDDNGATATFNPAGVAVLDGGVGSDTLDDNSDPTQSDHHLFEVFV